MKKMMFTLMLLMTFIGGAMAQNDAMYIYRNDGQINAFLKSDIDSLSYSHYDVDSVYHQEWQMQVVYTQDSIYQIPLGAIDSVSFVTPEEKYQPDVMRMDESWLDYVIEVGDDYILFKSTTPVIYLPVVGQVIVAETFEGVFSTGFAGRVADVTTTEDGIVCHVDCVELSEIYEHLVVVGKTESCEESDVKNDRKQIWGKNEGVRFPLPNVDIPIGPVTLSCVPNVTMDYIICIGEPNLKNCAKVTVKHQYDGSVRLDSKIDKDYKPEPKWLSSIPINTGVPGLYGKIQFGGFVRAEGSVQVSVTQPFVINGITGFEYAEGNLTPSNSWGASLQDTEFSVSLDGSIHAGLAVRVQFGIICQNLASADVTAYVGPELSGNFSLTTAGLFDRNLYKSLKDSKIDLAFKADLVPGYRFVGNERKDLRLSLNFQLGDPIHTWYLLPEFSDLDWTAKGTGGMLDGQVGRDLIMPVRLGWALYDESDDVRETYYLPGNYRRNKDWKDGLQQEISDLPAGETYTAFPFVEVLGKTLCSDEGVDVCREEAPVSITNFQVTKSEHEDDAYYNDGYYYDYRFDAATTVALDDRIERTAIKDWGYVYRDPYGREKRISLKSYSSPYTDTRYAYYRNEAKSTACLYGYVKYRGDDEYYYGEPCEYPLEHKESPLCPDGLHVHAIDLGLPSGTKWACCNVGASSPEEYGGYYAWGEVAEKGDYTWENYAYCNDNTGYQYIGSEISGTQYDVAHVQWGGSWRMPTQAQCKELIECCSSSWTSVNGVNGRKFVGPNGNSIFLPAAGYRWDDYLSYAGSYGGYWSGTLYDSFGYYAYSLYFGSGDLYWYSGDRDYGLSVRPVRQ